MDMEADLGIDSIKRVEIFGALTKQHPEMAGINPNELTELRTLQEIVSFVTKNSGVISTSSNGVAAPVVAPIITANTPTLQHPISSNGNGSSQQSSNGTMDVNELTASLLQVVSEKTGYPAEMLELKMDMEADLGIDSIKRVEIFGALTKQHPEMSGINPNELTELRTLQEIVSFVTSNSRTPTSNNGTVDASPQNNATSNTTTTTPHHAVSANENGVGQPSNNESVDVNKITTSLLQVVSEKTGYPAEMLELNMDMEADLGIDSIKRVEIFGALTKQHPEMSGINPNELTELRTLSEIVNHVTAHGKKKVIH